MSLSVLSSTTRTVSDVLDAILTRLRPCHSHAFCAAVTCTAIWTVLRWFRTSRGQLRTTQLRGPPSDSFLYGVGKRILDAEDSSAVYEAWAREYGPVYAVPSTLGNRRIVLCDPKAITHFYSKETWTYIQTPFIKKAVAMFGKGLLWADGEDHKRYFHHLTRSREETLTGSARQRKALIPAFSISAVRQLTPIFYNVAYTAKVAWDGLVESGGEKGVVIEVQSWMNHISLDVIGLAGFSHNFGALEGNHASVTEIFDAFPSIKVFFCWERSSHSSYGIPTSSTRLRQKLNVAMEKISSVLLARTQRELEFGVKEGEEERSVIGLLIKGADGDSGIHLTMDEITAQWALLELSRNPEIQTKLRNELLEHGADPTYVQLTNGLPYLNAVVHEILRIHPPLVEFTRVAIKDDVIPLSEPVRTQSGELVNNLTIAKGTLVAISIETMNRSAVIWGEDAKIFRPSRWLEDAGIPARAREIQGHRHLLSFADGPRTCLGKNFALTELKAVLTVLVKNFVFELRGVDSKIEIGRGVLPRPKIAGEVGCRLPLRVRPYLA
ncbi:cytochrome P450 [Lanmaoa asiatica]|nr:cytochrome P450 [Lanmaoa asiatica]